jgi:hypothetical protein
MSTEFMRRTDPHPECENSSLPLWPPPEDRVGGDIAHAFFEWCVCSLRRSPNAPSQDCSTRLAPPQVVGWPYAQGEDVAMSSAPENAANAEPETWQATPASSENSYGTPVAPVASKNLFTSPSVGEALRGIEPQVEVEETQIQLPVVQTAIQVPEHALLSVPGEVQRFPESQIRLTRNGMSRKYSNTTVHRNRSS